MQQKKLPQQLDISISDKQFTFLLDNEGLMDEQQATLHSSWHWPQPPPTRRCEIYTEIWMHLRDQESLTINNSINKLKEWSGVETANNSGNFPMSRHELLTMSSSKYVHTGVHTVTHAALAAFPKHIQHTEIVGCKEYLDENLGKKHLSIAFPYGSFNHDTLDVAKQTGLNGAFTTDPQPVTIHSDVYRLGRFQVINQNGIQFKKQLANWLNN